MDGLQIVAILVERIRLIAACAILAAGATFLVTNALPKTYEAETRLLVGQPLKVVTSSEDLQVAAQLSRTYAELASTRPVLRRVIDRLGLGIETSDLAQHVTARSEIDSLYISITARDGSAERAASIAQAVAAELIAQSPTVEIGNPPQPAGNLVSVVEPAEVPDSPVSPRVALSTILALVAGLLGGIGVAFGLDYLDPVMRRPTDVEGAAGWPTIGFTRRLSRRSLSSNPLVAVRAPASAEAEEFRGLVIQLSHALADVELPTLLVTSAEADDGKSHTAANLGVAFAQAGVRTVLVDANLHRPKLATLFNLGESVGFADLLRTADLPVASASKSTGDPRLRVVTAGRVTGNPTDLMTSTGLAGTIARLRVDTDLVIIDGPPLLDVTDAAILAARTDGTLVVVRASRTRRDAVDSVRSTLERVGARVVGATINQATPRLARSRVPFIPMTPSTTTPDRARTTTPRSSSPRRSTRVTATPTADATSSGAGSGQ